MDENKNETCSKMSSLNNNSLCRICLDEGATVSIFDSDGNGGNKFNKLCKCVNIKVENVEGHPRFICEKCNNTLDTVCQFIDTFIESSKIIESGLLSSIKYEYVTQYEQYSDFEYPEEDDKIKEEIHINDTKHESNDITHESNDIAHESNSVKPIVLRIKRETGAIKTLRNKKSEIKLLKHKTNKIGSSMLEGQFNWDGEVWSLNTDKTPMPSVINVLCKQKRKTKIKIKKIKTPKPKSESSKLCDVCGEVFESSKLSDHKRNKHRNKDKPVQCPKCPKLCRTKYDLNRHLKRKHDGTRDFICSVCGSQFFFQKDLNMHHKQVHEKHLMPKKIFKCKFCDKTYKCHKSVLVHERSVHTGERPEVCTICQATFFHIEYLREHMRLHTGEKPFKCPVCGRGYAQSGNMKSHFRNHKIADIAPEVLSKIRPSYLKYFKDNR